ncbi:branched-chain amino acid ABC transporter permease [Parafrankia sp. EUN1f]|uniref:branched-chain amino acid ABC transporter permease n=1 Tax=Parafrankia sp. EUN1f TaxID=102897 RepID=UPI0001C467FB|nr:branched-chain amino acid ABC transporter permease [Parafrankia sp. EUN1f]EFC80992.1 inner-membrane translocator [Parafrankia sp. EUN1f]
MGALQQVVDGLSAGSIYAALALALVLVHRATGVVNFAQGEMGVLMAYVAWSLTSAGVPVLVAVLAAMALSFPLGVATERFLIRRFHGQDGLVIVVVTVGLLILLNGIVGAIWGYVSKPFPSLFPNEVIRLGGVAVTVEQIGNLVVLLAVVAGLQIIFLRTRFGLSLRAVADNRESSALSGLAVNRLLMAGWGMAAALGTLAACLIAPKIFLDPSMMNAVLVYSLAAAVLGGLDSPVGAVVAALVIGVAENIAGAYIDIIGTDLKIAVPLLLMVVVLLGRPQGIFGRREVVRV